MAVSRFSEAEVRSFCPARPDDTLLPHAESGYAAFSAALIPGCSRPILGVPLPMLRQVAAALFRCFGGIPPIQPASFESVMLLGFCTALAPGSFEAQQARIEQFLPLIDNWSLCDSFCASLRFPAGEAEAWFAWLSALAGSTQPYEARFAAVCASSRFPAAVFGRRALHLLTTVTCTAYYTRMGVAWAAATLYRSLPSDVTALLEAGRFDVWTHNKTIQKICESRTTPSEAKRELRTLRRTEAPSN